MNATPPIPPVDEAPRRLDVYAVAAEPPAAPMAEGVQHAISTLHAHAAQMTARNTAAATPADAPEARIGVLLETYEFAIEAEVVSRAATTFTSSVNTLIKTQ